MSLQKKVEQRIARFKAGRLITYADFKEDYAQKPDALIKTFQRLVDKGILKRQKPGVFYKPKQTVFGALRPSEAEILKFFLTENGKYTGYLSGQDAFLKFKMSTQVPHTITIATSSPSAPKKINNLAIRYIKSMVSYFQSEDIEKLQLLDTIRLMKQAQDTTPDIITTRAITIISSWPDTDVQRLAKLAIQYSPSTRAVTGAILDKLNYTALSQALKTTLNPTTRYILSISASILPISAWNIIWRPNDPSQG